MLTSIYYSLAIAAYSIFLIQFFVAMFGGSDMDADIDFDGDGAMDLTWGDIFSFKGLIHFLMGFAGWLSLTAAKGSPILWYDYVIALAIGVGFVLMLVFLGKLLMKLRQEPTGTSGWDYVGHDGFITVVCSDEPDVYYVMLKDLGSTELKVYSRSKTKYKLASEVTIISYEDGKYFIN
jgi:hypothetical protein